MPRTGPVANALSLSRTERRRSSGADTGRIVAAAKRPAPQGERPALFGDGHAAEKIVRSLER